MGDVTIGQKLFELINPYDPGASCNPAQWHQVDEDWQAHYERAATTFLSSEAAASAVWDKAVEECMARIDEEIESLQEGLMTDAGLSKQDEVMMNAQIAAFIELKEIYRSAGHDGIVGISDPQRVDQQSVEDKRDADE